MRRMAHAIHGTQMLTSINAMIEDAKAVAGVAALLERSLEAGMSADGRVDMKEAAIYFIRQMRGNQL